MSESCLQPTGVLQPEIFNIKWKVERFFGGCEKVGDCYKSPVSSIPFAAITTKWFLQMYPKGETEKFKDCIALYLCSDNDSESKVTVDFRCSIISEQSSAPVAESKKTSYTFQGEGSWGWGQFVELKVLKDPKNGALIDDTLIISCDITFNEEIVKFRGYDEYLSIIESGSFDDYEKLCETGRHADVTFVVQDKKIKLHKSILSCRSSVFEAMFEHEMIEKNENSFDIPDIDYDVMKELFRFIYSRKVKNIDKIANELLIAADKYQVIELKALCEKTLYDKLTADNVIEYLKLTEMCDTIHLKNLVIKFVAASYKEIIGKFGFANLDSKVMCEIMQAIAR